MTGLVQPDGNHLIRGGVPFRVRGATYGSFVPRVDGELYPELWRIKHDLHAMADAGLNTLRTYTLPPVALLDIAEELDMSVLVGLHYDDWRFQEGTGRRLHSRVRDAGRRAVDEALERCAERPAVLALSVGNEVPADLVRLHGVAAVEGVLADLVGRVHDGTELLATYSNYPTTEYLHIEGQDLACFNVFLERPGELRSYLKRLQVVAGDIPLLVTELGLAAELHGEQAQAESLDEQLRTVDEVGCAGATVFSWTDEWGVAGQPVEGWGFGLTTAEREPKAALAVVRQWTRRSIRDLRDSWPSVSVVVCAYNEAHNIAPCLDSLAALDYPGLEVVVCDDGSTDDTLAIAQRYPFRVLALPHAGLSVARNAGIAAATGEVIAFLDADAACHPWWPYFLALSLEEPGVVATGGPNLPVPGAGFAERAVDRSPGGPVAVLVRDDRAEHVPGCTMAFRQEALAAIGGFDPVFTSAGDDVDVCWKLLDAGGEIGYTPAAQIRHRRRSTVRGYLRQQRGYGRSERMVSSRHPHRFNRIGQARWAGSIYGGPRVLPGLLRPVVYHGYFGLAPYQAVALRRPDMWLGWFAALLPLTVPLAAVGVLLTPFSPWWLLLPALMAGLLVGYAGAVAAAVRPERGEPRPVRLRALVGILHVLQPFARTWGRLRARRLAPEAKPPVSWTGDRVGWLHGLRRSLAGRRCTVQVGPASARYDLGVRVGPLLECRIVTAVVWQWTPRHRLSWRLRPWGIVAFALPPTAALLSVNAGTVLAAAAAVLLLAEAVMAAVVVRSALRATTDGAR